MPLVFDNSYARLPGRFFARQAPTPVAAPAMLALNRPLARALGLDSDWLATAQGLKMLAGNAVPAGAEPIAQAYAGHQFGGWVPQLGDGRAVLLGESVTAQGQRFDIVLKGAGTTPFSRGGDGRAWLGPVLREYIVSEAMAALGVPTTRALAAVSTGETVFRDGFARPGALFVRVAASHIRVGTFQYLAARGDIEGLSALARYTAERHFPGVTDALGLLRAVVAAQAQLIAQWMSLGFIHGVMNTDNMTVSGETIDYGPCAFMDSYHPETVFSSIDMRGRYAWARQPQAAIWNLAQLASALLPLIAQETAPNEAGGEDAAIEAATEAVNAFMTLYQAQWLSRFGRKIGIAAAKEDDTALIQDLLARMAQTGADFTRCFHGLSSAPAAGGPQTENRPFGGTASETAGPEASGRVAARDEFTDPAAFDAWAVAWADRLRGEADPQAVMRAANPVRIARNHRVEEVIAAASEGDLAPFEQLNAALAHPYQDAPEFAAYEAAPWPEQVVRRTFCGT